ncbi:response regulator [Shinella sp. HZN7]|uniref:response regulator n=1 Tax=Shinella sp. (strain HZN7) TaxID=879274 RepID=UPI000A05C05F
MKGDGVRRILVVEDEPLLRMAVVDLVEHAGFTALEAENADKALAILERRDDIRIVLTDIDMPGSLDGVALAWAVRDRWRAIKVIVMSGRVLDESKLPPGGAFLANPSMSGISLPLSSAFPYETRRHLRRIWCSEIASAKELAERCRWFMT